MDVNSYNDSDEKVAEPQKEKIFLSNEEVMTGLKVFGMGAGIGLAFYLVTLWALSAYFTLHYALIATIALAFTLFLLLAFHKSMGEEETRIQTPVLVVVAIAFIVTILIGYNKSDKKDNNKPKDNTVVTAKVFKSETLTFFGKERKIPHLVSVKEFKVTISGAPVYFVNRGKELTQDFGTYKFEVESNSSGDLLFIGTGSQSTATVEWKE